MMEPKLVDLDLWDDIMMGYETGKEDIAVLLQPVDVPEQDKELILRQEPQSAYRSAFEYVLENLISLGEFYPEQYLAIPYLVKIYEKWQQRNDFAWQLLFLSLIGEIISNNIPGNHDDDPENKITEEMIDSYLCSIEIMKDKAKKFLFDNMERLKQLSPIEISYFCRCFLAIVGDREAAYVLFRGDFRWCIPFCPNCGYLDEGIDFDLDLKRETVQETLRKIQPAASVIGQWDQNSFEDTYLWFSNLCHLLGDETDVRNLTYYYGVYTCPKCGQKGSVMELAKIGLMKR